MSTEIYYFSGTGNSLHIAKELQHRTPQTDIRPIISLLNEETVKISCDTVGFVFPIHLGMTPFPVLDFLNKLELESVRYIFAIATRAGSQHRAFDDLEKVLKKKGKGLDSFFTFNMGSNDPKFENWHNTTPDEIDEMESEIQISLDEIQKIVANKERKMEKDDNFTVHMPMFTLLSFFLPLLNKFYNIDFYSDSKCTVCGTCEKVCLSQKIKIINNKPLWQKDVPCFYCHACINFCPEQSIQIKSTRLLKSYTNKNGRYSHPFAAIEDILEQKK